MNKISSLIVTTLIIITLVSCTKKDPYNPPVSGLVFYSSFDGSFYDQSGKGIPVTDSSQHNYVKGIRGKALDFNGSTDYLMIPDSIRSGFGLSISFWIKTRGLLPFQNNGVVIGKYSFVHNARCFLIYAGGANDTRSDNRISAAFYREGYTSQLHDNVKSYLESSELLNYPSSPSLWSILHPERLTPDRWTHVVVNMSATTLSVWLDDVLCVTKTREYAAYFDSVKEPVTIGNCLSLGDGSNNHFNGQLDELRIYDRALTDSEIHMLYSAGN